MSKAANPKLIESVSKIAAETAVQVAVELFEKEKQKRHREKRDRRLRNTKLMLRNYRMFKIHAGELKTELDLLNDDSFLESLDSDEFAIEAIKRSKKRTIAMVTFIDQMLEVYRVLSERSNRVGDKRRYQVIYKLYIADDKQTIEQVAECLNVTSKTVDRDVKDAVQTLSSLMFGIDSIRFSD